MMLKPVSSEKAVKMIDADNTLVFETERRARKPEIKTEVERLFDVKVSSVRTQIRNNKKFAYVKLKKEYLASDVATKLGMI
ncbi:50S ribosomal protein L23 [Candidatus Pacearchaeota archaeon]|nr:MAG: 50S ribosomal protein L23 [Candidatus Pacearchaeota archaeon]